MIYDIIILGNGSQARRAALQLARAGKSVAVVYDELEGSQCAADELNHWLQIGEVDDAWTPTYRLFQQEMNQARLASDHWLNQFDIDFYQGTARFVEANSVLVSGIDGDALLEADSIIIATGEESLVRKDQVINKRFLITPNQLANGVELPAKIAIVYQDRASHGRWNCLENQSTIVSQLAGWKQIVSITESSTGRLIVQTKQQGTFIVDAILYDDHQAKTAGLGLDKINMNTDHRGHLLCNDDLQTNVAGIFGLGSAVRFDGREPDSDHVQLIVDQILNPEPALQDFSENDFQSLKLILQ